MSATATGAVITAWSAVSPFGIDRKHFLDGLRTGEPARHTAAAEGGVPGERGHAVPDFDVREVLGRKGTRAMDRVTALAVTAVGQVFDAGAAPGGTGLVLATSGSTQSMMDFTRSSLLGDKPYHVDPARMPNTVMNCAAGRCAIWYGLNGPNVTLASGRVSGLSAFRYATRLLARGRADTVLVGGAEEYSADRAWLDFHGREDGPAPRPLGEGACMMLLERAGTAAAGRPRALAITSRVFASDDLREALRGCVLAALAEAGVDPAAVDVVVPSGAGGRTGAQETEVLDAVFGAAQLLDVGALIGDTGAASACFGVVAALGEAETGARIAVVTSADADGSVACGVFGLPGHER
ncbi:3-oxoacyl-ACP synthase [Amycolatopsis sp. NBC_01488]|uniref:beta-ketoacyl synthase N-terminal-like domain-containing protein n=1 Tax=Amycolatopsis sp. NBC_01488 TaxID=2903563 RepID=UPI002E2CE522|nr:beta-ketoacyl synthase N-terminal-like domain-containing protein [Amycolatopsis sp. NBC_01488]